MTHKTKISLFLPFLVWCVFIYSLSAIPGRDIDTSIPDYVVHSIEYGVLSVLIYRIVGYYWKHTLWTVFVAFILSCIYAITDEIHQYFVPGRTPSFRDLAYDALGSVLALSVLWILLPLLPKKLLVIAKKLHILH